MSSQPNPAESTTEGSSPTMVHKRRMSTGQRLLFFLTAWLIVLMPFLFWWNTWFGRQLSDKQLEAYLHDDKKPRHIQHALIQIGERMAKHDTAVARWNPELLRLSAYPVEEVRNTDAWVMGQDTTGAGFHEALQKMLHDSAATVRGNAALSLVRFGDASGRAEIVALLQPAQIPAPLSGTITDASTPGTAIHQGGVIAKLEAAGQVVELRSPITGRIREIPFHTGSRVASGIPVATITPAAEQVWEALRALYLIGVPSDLSAISPYKRDLPDIPDHVRQQAVETERAITERARK